MIRAGLRAAAVSAAALCAAACSSRWYLDGAHRQIVRTEVVVHTVPEGQVVWFNGLRQAEAPVRIPVEYEYRVEQYFRQTNYGAQMREDAEGASGALLYPLSLPASLVHGREEMKRHSYHGNRHVVSIRPDGVDPVETQIVLQGEEEYEITLTMPQALPQAR